MLQRISCLEPNQHYFWYEAFVYRDRKREKVASGYLEQLTLELPEVKTAEQGDNFKLQLPENLRGSTWFTKSALTSAPETSKICKSLMSEMAQLEEARRFHLQLYSQGHKEHPGSGKTDCQAELKTPMRLCRRANTDELKTSMKLNFSGAWKQGRKCHQGETGKSLALSS